MDPLKFTNIVAIDDDHDNESGKLSYSVIRGISFKGKRAHKKMSKLIKSPRLALFECSLELKFSKNEADPVDLSDISANQLAEMQWRQKLVDMVLRLNIDLVFVRGHVSYDIRELLYENKICVISNVAWDDISRVSRMANCELTESDFVVSGKIPTAVIEKYQVQRYKSLFDDSDYVLLEDETCRSHMTVLLCFQNDLLETISQVVYKSIRYAHFLQCLQALDIGPPKAREFNDLEFSAVQVQRELGTPIASPSHISIEICDEMDISLWEVLSSLNGHDPVLFDPTNFYFFIRGTKAIRMSIERNNGNTPQSVAECLYWVEKEENVIDIKPIRRQALAVSFYGLLSHLLHHSNDICFSLPQSQNFIKFTSTALSLYDIKSVHFVTGLEYEMDYRNEALALQQLLHIVRRICAQNELLEESDKTTELLQSLFDEEAVISITRLRQLYCRLLEMIRSNDLISSSIHPALTFCEGLYTPSRDALTQFPDSKWSVQYDATGVFSNPPLIVQEPSSIYACALSTPVYFSGADLAEDNSPLVIHFSPSKSQFIDCTCYFWKRFQSIRERLGFNNLNYIESLTRCRIWKNNGGKSRAKFYRTLDDRFVLKQLAEFEVQQISAWVNGYFDHLNAHASLLLPILGIFKISSNVPGLSEEVKIFMVTPNLFHGFTVDRIFDLKGKLLRKKMDRVDKVEFDESFLKFDDGLPLLMEKQVFEKFSETIALDTAFLEACEIMDYSLLAGINISSKTVVVGFIDFFRKFTFDKRMESKLKHVLEDSPTILDPVCYRNRFLKSFKMYFLGSLL